MMPITHEWVNKAEGDFAMMEREGRARKRPNYDGICFHAQQCAEKYLNSRLRSEASPFAKPLWRDKSPWHAGFKMPKARFTVNLAPANIKKEGPSFDLPIAMGVLATEEDIVPQEVLKNFAWSWIFLD